MRLEKVESWLDEVQELLSRDTAELRDAHNLQDDLNQCKVTRITLIDSTFGILIIYK